MEHEKAEARQRNGNAGLIAAIVAIAIAIGAVIWCYGLNNHLNAAERGLQEAQQRNAQMSQEQEALSARLRATTETLGQTLGMTQKQIDEKTQALIAAQASQAAAVRAQNVQTARLAQAQAATNKQVGDVASSVTAVQSDVTGAKASIADTQSDLQTTKAQLQRTIGDAGVMSGLIATNHEELEQLKHKGDRNYFEFTLQKGAQPTLLGTIKVQLKKVDVKKSKYTLMVSADDKNIEKKDKNLDEPVQFYSGKDPALFEIVVNNVAKNQVSGYLSTPKNAGGSHS